MIRTEIYHPSPMASLSRLMPLRFLLAFLCATECHESRSASENGPQRRTSECQAYSRCLLRFLLSPKAGSSSPIEVLNATKEWSPLHAGSGLSSHDVSEFSETTSELLGPCWDKQIDINGFAKIHNWHFFFLISHCALK